MQLRLRLEVIWEDGMQSVGNIEAAGQAASRLLHLLGTALEGTPEEFIAARIAFEMSRGRPYARIARGLGLSKKTIWEYRKKHNLHYEITVARSLAARAAARERRRAAGGLYDPG